MRGLFRLSDRIFYPLVFVAACTLVWLALRSPANTLPTGAVSGADTDYRVIRVAGADLNRFEAGSEAEGQLRRGSTDFTLLIQANTEAFPAAPDAGPHFRLASDLETAFSGRRIRITVRARSSETNGASALEINYLAGPEGRSGWRKFDLGPDFSNYTFDFMVPEAEAEQGFDFIGVRPVIGSKTNRIEIESLTLINLSLWHQTIR